MAVGILRSAPAGQAPLLAWPLICGAAVAEKTQALDFHGGILRVRVPDAGWRCELSRLAPQYSAALHDLAGEKVLSIAFVLPHEA